MADDATTERAWNAKTRLSAAVFSLAAIFCLTPWGSPPVALALGIVLALTFANPFAKQSKGYSRPLLQLSVVLLGFTMDLNVVLKAGANGALFAAATIASTLTLGWLLGRALKISERTATLISSGTAICGGSAIAAVGSVIGAAEGEMSVALGTVFLLNAVALYIFPAIGHALNLSQTQFGTWAGVAIHDISSVVGAASVYGAGSLATATAVKLSRALWIVPLAFGAMALRGNSEGGKAKVQIPWFIGIFLLASLSRLEVPAIGPAIPALSYFAKAGMTLTLFLIGSSLSKSMLKTVGWKPMLQGVLLWLFISVGALLVITRF